MVITKFMAIFLASGAVMVAIFLLYNSPILLDLEWLDHLESLPFNVDQKEKGKGSKVVQPDRDVSRLIILSWQRDCTTTEGNVIKGCGMPAQHSCLHTCDPAMYNVSDLVLFNLRAEPPFPMQRSPQQKWVFREIESPPQSMSVWPPPTILSRVKDAFNLSSTYASDSDVPVSSVSKCSVDADRLKSISALQVNYLKNKTHNVAWFVSHCKTQARREEYVAELQKYIDVDIYGRCGNLTCGSKINRTAKCAMHLLNYTYRFYLSFENSLCHDYVTEKIGNVIHHHLNVIPVVLGGIDYSTYLPGGTYIDVKDFPTPKDLASHLHSLAANATLYNDYICSKNAVKCLSQLEGSYLCRLCKHAHLQHGKMQVLDDITHYWSIEKRCFSPVHYLPSFFSTHI